MRISRYHGSRPERRGAALMLSFLVLIVLILIVQQISYSTKTDARVARNEESMIMMDAAIESYLLQIYDDLKADAEGGGAAGSGESPFEGGASDASDPFGEAAGAAGGGAGPIDSREDGWAKPQRTELNEMQLRVVIQDEDSKFNLLSILTPNEEEAQKAFERLVRVIEYSRAGTELEIDGGSARHMATTILEFMNRRQDQTLPAPVLLSNDPDNDDIGYPLTLMEYGAVDPEAFGIGMFRDLRDEDDRIVHSLSSFLTVWSSLSTAGAEPPSSSGAPPPATSNDEDTEEGNEGDESAEGDQSGQGESQGQGQPGQQGQQQAEPAVADGRINLNTAPVAVLRALLDDRDLPYDFWDNVLEFRNEPLDDADDGEDENIQLDEFGEEVVPKKFFQSLDDLDQIDGWGTIEPAYQAELKNLLKVQSSVFSIYVTARVPTGEERIDPLSRREDIEREEAEGQGLVRTVRSVVWRRALDSGDVEIVPIIRWEVLDYVPYPVEDFPGEDR